MVMSISPLGKARFVGKQALEPPVHVRQHSGRLFGKLVALVDQSAMVARGINGHILQARDFTLVRLQVG